MSEPTRNSTSATPYAVPVAGGCAVYEKKEVLDEEQHRENLSPTQKKSISGGEITLILCGFIVCGIIGGIIGGFIGNIGGGFIGVFIGLLVWFICLLTEAECCVFC